MNERRDVPVILHSKKMMASYSTGSFLYQLVEGVLVFMLFFYYETEIGLQSWMTGLALVIYAVYDAFNDPIVGYISDRPYKFTKKWGRRFPFMLFSYIPMLIMFLLIFSPPVTSAQGNQWIIFGWLILTTCLFDTFESFFTINFFGLFPDKFRDGSERITASALGVYIGFIGILFSFILPPMIIIFGQIDTYILMAWITVIMSVCGWVLTLPGLRDDKETLDHFIEHYDDTKRDSFFSAFSDALRQKNYRTLLIMYLFYQCLTITMIASLWYTVRFVLKASPGTLVIIVLLLMVGGLISVPFWSKYSEKTGDSKKTMIISGFIMVITAGMLTFIGASVIGYYVLLFIFGLGLGGFWVMLNPTFSDVIDESVIITEKRREGMYGGFRFFMSNVAKVILAIILATVHELTGFQERGESQSATAIFGIQLHQGLIPAVLLAIGLLIFWKFYDITPDKSKMIKEKLIELKI